MDTRCQRKLEIRLKMAVRSTIWVHAGFHELSQLLKGGPKIRLSVEDNMTFVHQDAFEPRRCIGAGFAFRLISLTLFMLAGQKGIWLIYEMPRAVVEYENGFWYFGPCAFSKASTAFRRLKARSLCAFHCHIHLSLS